MAKNAVVNAGTLTVGSTAVAELRNVRATKTQNTASGHAIGDGFVEEAKISAQWEITAEAYSATTELPLTSQAAAVAAKLTSQKTATPTTIFDGAVVVTQVGDTQNDGEYEVQSITMKSNGTPTTG